MYSNELKINYLAILLVFFMIIPGYHAQNIDHNYQMIRSGDWVQDKNFYLFTLLEQLPEVKEVISEDEILKGIWERKLAGLTKAADSCSMEIICHVEAVLWTESEIGKIGNRIVAMWEQEEEIKHLVIHHMRASGCFQLYAEESDKVMIQKAWEDAAKGINHIIEVYALSGEQRYPAIDSVSYDIAQRYYKMLIDSMMGLLKEKSSGMKLFFQPSLAFALGLLDMNNRDESARFEPMMSGENRAAFEAIPEIEWEKYPYSVMLVPGHGPDEPQIALSPLAKIRDELAAMRYKAGQAPLIIVSGGYVHPFQTPFCEALEMKRDLMARHNIPEYAILIEPHARHTTTNFRNAARLIYRYGIPADKKALVTTGKYQSYYIKDMNLDERCRKELGYIPYELFERLNPYDVEWKPKLEALHQDAIDPLDP